MSLFVVPVLLSEEHVKNTFRVIIKNVENVTSRNEPLQKCHEDDSSVRNLPFTIILSGGSPSLLHTV